MLSWLTTSRNVHQKLESWQTCSAFLYFQVAVSWQCRRFSFMPESPCLGGHGISLMPFPVQEHNQREFLWSRQTLMMYAYYTLCPLILPQLSIIFVLPLPFFQSSVCLLAFHRLSLSLCLNPYHSRNLSLSHTLPHMIKLVLAKPVCWLVWVGTSDCVTFFVW